MNRHWKLWISKPTVPSCPLKWSVTWSSSSTINSQWSTTFHQSQELATSLAAESVRWGVDSMNIVLKSWIKVSYHHELTTAIMFWLVFLKRLCIAIDVCPTRCCTSKKDFRPRDHVTPSLQQLHCTGFQSMPEFTSRSVLSCTIYTQTLHHTNCHPWSHPAPPSCPGRVCNLFPKATSSAFDPAWSLEIESSQSMVRWPGTAFQNRSAALQLLDNPSHDWKLTCFYLSINSHVLLISTRYRERLFLYCLCIVLQCIVVHSSALEL